MSDNPLSKYFRVPGIHVSLPSGGRFSDPGAIRLAMNGEIAVYPMTAADEVITKNPDALLNGYSIESIIRSCVPDVKDPRSLPAQDMDVLLLAIKLTSYGDEMAISGKCPKCGQVHENGISIRGILATSVDLEESYSVRIDDNLLVDLRPYDYDSTTKLNLAAFEEAKLFQNLIRVDLGLDQRQKVFAESFEKISLLNLDLLARCVRRVVIQEGVVEDPVMIKEFIQNTTKDTIKKIQDKLSEMSSAGIDRKIPMVCENEACGHEWTTELIFDPAHFFE